LDRAPTTGDALLLERLVLNLVHNAVRHNVPGGRVEVRTRSSQSGAVHRGSVTATTRQGGGLDVTVTLPAR